LLASIESADIYDATTIRSFLQSPIFENMLGGILYEGIFEFLQRVDIVGNVINKLPVIGPIRVAIMKEVRAGLDKSLGAQIKLFLSSFNKVAVQRMADFVLSPQNRQAFSKALRNLADLLLSRPLGSLLPPSPSPPPLTALAPLKGAPPTASPPSLSMRGLKGSMWATLRDTPIAQVKNLTSVLYGRVGDERVGDYFTSEDVFRLFAVVPTAGKVLNRNLERFLDSDNGRESFQTLTNIKNNVEIASAEKSKLIN
jgi:hypothetical protein